MTRERHAGGDIREALLALLSDIEGMYEGGEISGKGGQPEEYFGPFSVGKLSGPEVGAEISVSWPNLAISMRNAKIALGSADEDDAS
jgi:hypothetical protein